VLNNPTTQTDPLGLCQCSPAQPDCHQPCQIGSCREPGVWPPPAGSSGLCANNGILTGCGSILGYAASNIFSLLFPTGCDESGCGATLDFNAADALGAIVAVGPSTATANNTPVVLQNPCQVQGRALPPSAYGASGQTAKNSTTDFVLNVAMDWPKGHNLDSQQLASGTIWQNAAYGNYVYGVYMAGAGVSLSTALSGANTYAFFRSHYPAGTPMDPNYGSLPAANVVNITNGYNAQLNGTVRCRRRI
jgi:hypothetical protein